MTPYKPSSALPPRVYWANHDRLWRSISGDDTTTKEAALSDRREDTPEEDNKAVPVVKLSEHNQLLAAAVAEARAEIIRELREDAYRCTFADYNGSMDKGWLYSVADHLEKKAAQARDAE